MIRSMVIREILKHGGSVELAERLLIQGDRPFLAWLTHKYCASAEGKTIEGALEAFAYVACLPLEKARYAYYAYSSNKLSYFKKLDGYKYVRSAVEERYPYPKLWDELLTYAYKAACRLAIEIEVERGTDPAEIEDRLSVSQSLVYKVRNEFLTRFIQQKGDYIDDIKFY